MAVDHENNLVEVRRNACDVPQAIKHLELEFGHTLIEHNLLEEGHQNDLTVSLATVTRL